MATTMAAMSATSTARVVWIGLSFDGHAAERMVAPPQSWVILFVYVFDEMLWQSGSDGRKTTFLGPSLLGRVGRRVRWRSYTPWLV
jgi:hypothetical protein